MFGRLADRLGRKFVYGYELVVLAIGAIASALSPNVLFLLIFRFILGLGIGGDYPVSATLMSEYANRQDRGEVITVVFLMEGFGLILGPVVALVLLTSGMSQDLTWRLMLGFGAIPALATFYLRRQIAETPRFTLMMNGDVETARQTANHVTNGSKNNGTVYTKVKQEKRRAQKSQISLLFTRRYLGWMIGTAGAWFLLAISYYWSTTSNALILKMLNPLPNHVTNILYVLLLFLIATLPR